MASGVTLITLYVTILHGTNQFVDISNKYSGDATSQYPFSLPKGSNLIYINGIFELKLNGELILFADDTVLTYFGCDSRELNNKMQEDFCTIVN